MIHPTAVIGEPPQMRIWHEERGENVFQPDIASTARIGALTVVDSGYERPTLVGERSWIMAQVHVGHDVIVCDDCEVASGTVLGGYCVLEPRVRIGINVTVLPYRRIGEGARIGAGAVVTKDVPPGEVWAGNPARCFHESWVR